MSNQIDDNSDGRMRSQLEKPLGVSYGLKSSEQLSRSTKMPIGPSTQTQTFRTKVQDYFFKKVDPIVADCVTHLLFTQPDDVVAEMLNYLQTRRGLGEGEAMPPSAPRAGKTKKSHKIFLATRISPVLSYLMNQIAYNRPERVMDFMIETLPVTPIASTKASTPGHSGRPPRPQTAAVARTASPQKQKGSSYTIDARNGGSSSIPNRPTTAPSIGRDDDNDSTTTTKSKSRSKSTDVKVTEAASIRPEEGDAEAVYKIGQGVEIRRNGGVKWYSAYITTATPEGMYDVAYITGERESSVETKFLRAWQPGIGDAVEVQYKGGVRYYQAFISGVSKTDGAAYSIYTVTYDDGRQESNVDEVRIRSRRTGMGSIQIGERVEARYHRGRKWFPGRVVDVSTDDVTTNTITFSVIYEDGDSESGVKASYVRSLEDSSIGRRTGAIVANFREGSRIEFAAEVESGLTKWLKATITSERGNACYDLKLDAGEKHLAVPESALRPLETYPIVEVRHRGGKKWFPASITRDNYNGSFDIDYDDGDMEENVPARYIRRLEDKKDAAASVMLEIGSPVRARFKGGQKWYDGAVKSANKDGTYDVRYADGDSERFVPARLVRFDPNGSMAQDQSQDDMMEESLDESIGSLDSLPVGVDLTKKYHLGMRVEAQFGRKHKFYKGQIVAVLPNDRYDINYNDGDKERSVHVRYIRLDPRLIQCARDTSRLIMGRIMDKYKPPPPKEIVVRQITIAVLGIDGAGKTSFLNALQGDALAKVRPTVGFKPLSMMLSEEMRVRFYDLGGGKKIRGIWEQYFHDVHAVIYVTDASDQDRFEETAAMFKSTISHKSLKDKPICILANKCDAEGCVSAAEMAETLGVDSNGLINVVSSSCLATSEEGESHDSVEAAVEWVLACAQDNYKLLNDRVEKETSLRKAEEQKKKLARERKVLRNKIASAFPSQVGATDLLPLGVTPDSAPDECLEKEEGLVFLASEIGITQADLPAAAVQVAEEVGYQRLALQIIGGLNNPVSKKKEPLSWDDIAELVKDIRLELQM